MEETGTTNWVPGLVVLGVAAAAAVVFLLSSRKLKADAAAPKTLDDEKARYDGVIEQLKAHQGQKHLMTAEAFAAEKTRLEQLAASYLRQMREHKHEAQKQEARAEKAAAVAAQSAQGGNWQSLLVGAAIVLVFIFIGYKMSENTSERAEGGSITGGMPGGRGGMGGQGAQAPAEPPMDPELEALYRFTQAQPDNADALADLSLYLVRRQAFDDAAPFVNRLTTIDPYDVRGRLLRTTLGALDGDMPKALAELERLADRYPDAFDARLFAGMMAVDLKDITRANANFDKYLLQAPPDEVPAEIAQGIAAFKADAARSAAPGPTPGPGAPTPGTATMPPGHP